MPTSTGYTRSPRLQTGALIQLNRDIIGIVPSIILFQYNPEEIERNFSFSRPESEGNFDGLVPVTDEKFAPGESFGFTLEFDATDDLEKGRFLAESFGVADRLAALERLIYAPRGLLGAFAESFVSLLGEGPLKKAARQKVPIVLLALGRRRVVPVVVTSFSITETAHNPAMMPIHARVSLALEVIQPHQLPKRTLIGLPELDVELARATYHLYRFQRDTLALAHLATVVSDLQP